jgi:hypothetical protein
MTRSPTRGASRPTRNPVRAAAMRAQRGRATERPPALRQTNSPDFAFAADLLEATGLLLARLLLARLVLAVCLFDVDMSSLRLRGDRLNLRVSIRASYWSKT